MVPALKRRDCRDRRFKDATSNVMCPRSVPGVGVEAMSPRIPLASLVVLAALALAPAALAQETDETASEVLAWTGETFGVWVDDGDVASEGADASPSLVVTGVVLLGPPPARDAPAEPQDDAPPAEPREETPESEPSRRRGLFGGLDDALGPLPLELPSAVDGLLGSTGLGLPLAAHDEAPVTRAAAPAVMPAPPARTAAPAAAADADPSSGPSAVLVALASTAAIASVAAGPAFDWERIRRFGFLALLYTRIAKDRLLDHGRRESLLSAIRERPGMTLSDVAEATGIPRNTATYHLNRLEKEGLLASARQGRNRHYFLVGGDVRKTQADAFAALRHDKGRALALAVGASPGMDQQALCAKLGLAPSLVHWHADRLLAAGVLSKSREGRHVRYHPGPAYALVATSDATPDGRAALPC